jgi:hypothetical protein
MKKFTISLVVACTVCVSAAVAQMAPGNPSQGTQQSSPGMGGPRGQQPGMGQPDQNDPTNQTNQTGNNTNRTDNGERKLKGCVQSQAGQYMLETKKGKDIALTGQDVSTHVGHEVALKGTWEKGSMSQSSTGNASEKAFNVTDVKMISDSCGGKGRHSDMNNSSNTGSGSSPGNTGSTQGTGATGTQPPQ